MNEGSRLSPLRGDAHAVDTSSGQAVWPGSSPGASPGTETMQQTGETQAEAEKRRRERKRFTDKLAQRHHRKRQKLYIEELEGRLNMLKSGADLGTAELIAQNLRLQEELKNMHSLWDEMEALIQRQRQLRCESVLNTARGSKPGSPDPTKTTSGMQHPHPSEEFNPVPVTESLPNVDQLHPDQSQNQKQNLSVHDPSQQQPPRTGINDISTIGGTDTLSEGHAGHMDALMMESTTETADVPFDRRHLHTTATSGNINAPIQTNAPFDDQSRPSDAIYADMGPGIFAFDTLSRLFQQTNTAAQEDFISHADPLYYTQNDSQGHESPSQMQQFDLANNISYLAGSPRQNSSTVPKPDDILQKDSRQSLHGATMWSPGGQPFSSFLLSPLRGSPIPGGHNTLRQPSPIASSALSIKNMMELLGVDFGEWLPLSSQSLSEPAARGNLQSRALPLNRNPPSPQDREVSAIIDQARANIGSIGPPTLVDFLFDNPKNTLSIDLKKLLEPVRQRRRTSEFLATYWVLYLLFRWQIVGDEEAYQDLPTWLRPTRLQLTVSHPIAADLVAWPEMREELIHMSISDEIGFYDVSRDIVRYLTVDIQTLDEAALNDPKRLEAEILDLKNWKLGHGFFDRYPHWKWLHKGNGSLGVPSNPSNPLNHSNTSRTNIGTSLS